MPVNARITALGDLLILGEIIEGQGTVRFEADGDLLVEEFIEDGALPVLLRRGATHTVTVKGELIEGAVL